MKRRLTILVASLAGGLAFHAAELRIGIIGCDTSHVPAFAEAFNNPQDKDYVPGGKVVAAFKGGSVDIPRSASRVDDFAQTLREKYGVKFYDSIEALCTNVDVVLLESVDGRVHLAQIRPVIAARKPVFIDKPMATSLKDVLEIFRLAQAANVPVFSSSSLRFGKNTQAVRGGKIGRVNYAETYSPVELEEHHPDLFWYGIHGVESLFTVMGTGCESVQRIATTNGLIETVGNWSGGRKGIFCQDAERKYHGLARGVEGEAPVGAFDGYGPLDVEIMKFFQTGIAPVKPEETIEIIAFMAADNESRRNGNSVVRISDVIHQAGSDFKSKTR